MLRNFNVLQFILMILPLVVAVVLHELAHGYAADKMGDPTARLAGRLTLNPLKHLDVFGSFLLPVALKLSGSPVIFGYAKPVPVNFANLRPFRKGALWVASAGVLTNMILAVVSAGLFRMVEVTEASWAHTSLELPAVLFLQLLANSVIINCVLALFNLFVLLITGPLGRLMTFLLLPLVDFLLG